MLLHPRVGYALGRHGDVLAAQMLSMWRLPAFAVGCSQVVVPVVPRG